MTIKNIWQHVILLREKYKEAIALDPSNTTAWERYAPTKPEAFVAQALKMHTGASSIQRTYLHIGRKVL